MTSLLDDIADIRATIRYWRNIGVCVVDVAAELRCTRSWPAVERRMMEIMLAYELLRAA